MMNSNITRIDLSEGHYATVSNKILNDTRLSGDAVRLLMLLLNCPRDWVIYLEYYTNQFGWNQSRLVKNLVECGYLRTTKTSQGKGKGFRYFFTISERGDLKQNPPEADLPTQMHSQPKADDKVTGLEDLSSLVTELFEIGPNEESQKKSPVANNAVEQPTSLTLKEGIDIFDEIIQTVNTLGDDSYKKRQYENVLRYFKIQLKGGLIKSEEHAKLFIINCYKSSHAANERIKRHMYKR
jgi:hypothetical protein